LDSISHPTPEIAAGVVVTAFVVYLFEALGYRIVLS
jgi:hypothetical protein